MMTGSTVMLVSLVDGDFRCANAPECCSASQQSRHFDVKIGQWLMCDVCGGALIDVEGLEPPADVSGSKSLA